MKYQLVIFDMDGTILNTIDDLADSMNVILKKYNLPVHTTEKIKSMVGHGIPNLVEQAVSPSVPKDSDLYKTILNDFIPYYKAHSAEKTKAYDGIIQVLKELRKMGIRTAVNTNKIEDAAKLLVEKYFPDCFDYVSGGKLDKAPKPSPDGNYEIFKAANLTPVEAKSCACYIGDSDVDFKTALNSGLDFIGCAWGFKGSAFLKALGAKNVAEKPEEILKIICNK